MPSSELLDVWSSYSDGVLTIGGFKQNTSELSHVILEDGIILTGGAPMTGLLARRVQDATGPQTRVDDLPLHAAASGLSKVLERRA